MTGKPLYGHFRMGMLRKADFTLHGVLIRNVLICARWNTTARREYSSSPRAKGCILRLHCYVVIETCPDQIGAFLVNLKTAFKSIHSMRPNRLVSLAAVLSSLPSPCHTIRPCIAEATPATGIPSFAELEAAGAVIGEIRISTQDIFDLEDPTEKCVSLSPRK